MKHAMNEFDTKAFEWDKNNTHLERSAAIASELQKMIPLDNSMKALEYGAGTGLLSFNLKNLFAEITLMDSSTEMIKICNEKIRFYDTKHIKTILFDLEKSDYNQTFDIIYNQMVLHHVMEIDKIFRKFFSMLNSEGYLAIADLFPEDGSFHGPEANVHKGFDPDNLKTRLVDIGFKNTEYKNCFVIKREGEKKYPVFLLVAKKD